MRLNVLLLKLNSPTDELIPPVGLGYLATAIRNKHEVKILDGIKENLTLDKLAEVLKADSYDIVGLQIFTRHIVLARAYLKLIRKILPSAQIILGGPHPSCQPQTIFKHFPEASWAFWGEAEIGLAQLLDLIQLGRIRDEELVGIHGLIWRRGGLTQINSPTFVENLDNLGMPSWDLIEPDSYPLSPHGTFFKKYPVAPIVVSRGCPFQCTYCAGHLVSGRKIRYRSVNNVLEEIELLYQRYGIREIHIEDDNFTADRRFVEEFCAKLRASGLKISWTCPNGVRLDTLTEDLILKMKDVGLYSLSVGIESGSNKILKDMKKNLTTEKIKEKIVLIKKCGLEASGFFIIGYPTETLLEIQETIDFALSLDLDRAGFFLFKPFPGTEITEELIRRGELGEISNGEWGKFILADAVYAPPGLSKEQLKSLRKKALLQFYLRPKIIWRFIKNVHSFKQIFLILGRAYSWLIKAQ